MLEAIEKNIRSRKETDRIMWFSMWILLSIASFGIAGILMIYYIIKRRNEHMLRQRNLEQMVQNYLKDPKPAEDIKSYYNLFDKKSKLKNPKTWAISSIIFFPILYILYHIDLDLQTHEEHQQSFINETISRVRDKGLKINLHELHITTIAPPGLYLIFTILTFGLGGLYWLFRIFNNYNNHIKKQWIFEDELIKTLKSS